MKLIRVGEIGSEIPGILDGQVARSLSGVIPEITGATLSSDALAAMRRLNLDQLPALPATARLGSPISAVGKIICVGLNYTDHAAESSMPVPTEPVLFFKSTSSICGAYDNVVNPEGCRKLDWEVELGVVIGKPARRVAVERALEYVGGYLIVNDVSEREWQLERGGQWVKGKSHDTFSPLGPWLVTSDEVPDPNSLALWLSVNGQPFQSGNTHNMIFKVPHLVSYISRFMTLMPGDIISTGTPAGVGLGQRPPRYLEPGDVLELGIEGLGAQRQCVVAEQPV